MTGPRCRRRLSTPRLAACALWAGLAAEAAAQGSAASDRAVLEALYDATGGPDWIDNTNWKGAAPLGEWFGVTTDTAGRVRSLVLSGNGLAGPIPAELRNLANLELLYLWNNALTGPIPVELGRLTRLRALDLGSNELTGPIPAELGNLANLELLYLSRNALTGPIPVELGRLTRLRALELGRNELTGPIPPGLGNLANLEALDLGRNELTGPIPAELGNLANLEALYLWNNALTGPIPVELGRLTRLRALELGRNELTGPIPAELGNLANLELLYLWNNALTGPIPAELGRLTRLRALELGRNELTGPIPAELGNLANLEFLYLQWNWGLSGRLPADLRRAPIESLEIMFTRVCAPAAWRDWLKTINFSGRLCGSGTDVIDVAVVYTPGAREAAGGTAAIEAVIDLMVAETNRSYAASEVHHRLALVERSEVQYVETGDSGVDLRRLSDPSDGHMDEVHALRDQVGADLVHLIVGESDVGGKAHLGGAFGLSVQHGGAFTFAHELGHNMALRHDRYEVYHNTTGDLDVESHPAYGYVNQQAFEEGAATSSRWRTIMAYANQCADASITCARLLRFSNPRQSYLGDPLGVAYGTGGSGLTGPADAAAVLNATGPAVALWRDPPTRGNRPPVAVGTLTSLVMGVDEAPVTVEVTGAFRDPDGDRLTYGAISSAPRVATVALSGSRVIVTPVTAGTATVTVTATDGSSTSATQRFTVTVTAPGSFVDDPLVPGITPIKAIHFTELRARIDALLEEAGLGRFAWTDPDLRAGVTRVRLVHLTELRSALAEAYAAAGRAAPRWADASPSPGSTPIRAAHVTELRAAVLALE